MRIPIVLFTLLLAVSSVDTAPIPSHAHVVTISQAPHHLHAHGARARNRFIQDDADDGWVLVSYDERKPPGMHKEALYMGDLNSGGMKIQIKEKPKDGNVKATERIVTTKESIAKEWYQENEKIVKQHTIPVVMPGSEKASEVFGEGKDRAKKTEAKAVEGEPTKRRSRDRKERAKERKEAMMTEWLEGYLGLVKQDGSGNGAMLAKQKQR